MAYTFQFEVYDFATGLPVFNPIFLDGDIVLNPGPNEVVITATPEPLHGSGSLQTITVLDAVSDGDRIEIKSTAGIWSGGVEIVSGDPVRSLVDSVLTIVREIPGKNTGEYDRRHTDGRIVREQILPVNDGRPTE